MATHFSSSPSSSAPFTLPSHESHLPSSSLTASSPTVAKWVCMLLLPLVFLGIAAWDFSFLRLQHIHFPSSSSGSSPSASSSLSTQVHRLLRLSKPLSSLHHSFYSSFSASSTPEFQTSQQSTAAHKDTITSPTTLQQQEPINDSLVRLLTDRQNELKYIPSINTLVYTVAKGGSTTIWRHLYTGLTGQRWSALGCKGFVQDPRAPCWKGLMYDLNTLPLAERKRLMTATPGDGVFRVAVTRHPLQRLISAFKSKYSCDHFLTFSSKSDESSSSSSNSDIYSYSGDTKSISSRGTTNSTSVTLDERQNENINNRKQETLTIANEISTSKTADETLIRRLAERHGVVTRLRRDGNVSESVIATSPPCMNISEFASLLDAIRHKVGRWGYTPGLHYLENHIRPQQHFLDVLAFDVVLDIRQWRDYAVVMFEKRLKYGEMFEDIVKTEVTTSHHTEHLRVEIDDRTAVKLADFAALSAYGKLTYEVKE